MKPQEKCIILRVVADSPRRLPGPPYCGCDLRVWLCYWDGAPLPPENIDGCADLCHEGLAVFCLRLAETYRWGFQTNQDVEAATKYYVMACNMGLGCKRLENWLAGERFPEQFRLLRGRDKRN